jgi:hypothetical protein
MRGREGVSAREREIERERERERADQIQEGLTFVVWPLIGIVYAIWLVT